MESKFVFNLDLNHFKATLDDSSCSISVLTDQDEINLNEFQILLVKFLPCSHKLLSKSKSFPAGDDNNIPTLTPSAPYFSINSKGSGLLPSDLDIFLPNLSLTIPVKYTFLKGGNSLYSYPEIIILATQKNMISGAVTKSLVG